MGVTTFKTLNPQIYQQHHETLGQLTPTYNHPFDLCRGSRLPFSLVQISSGQSWVIYQAAVGQINFALKAVVCPVQHGELFVIHKQNSQGVFGTVRNGSGEVFFKRRISLKSTTLENALEELCHRKALSLLELGENVAHIFGFDVEIYPSFLQYCSQFPVIQHKLFSQKIIQKQATSILSTLKQHGMGIAEAPNVETAKELIAYSPTFRKYILRASCLVRVEGELWQLEIEKKTPDTPSNGINAFDNNSGLLSVQSNMETQYDKMLRNHDNSVKQILRHRQSVNSLDQQLNRLENLIYMNNQQVETITRQKIDKDLRSNVRTLQSRQLTLKYYSCLEHFLQRAGRRKELPDIIKLVMFYSDSQQNKADCLRRLATLEIDQQNVQRLIMEDSLMQNTSLYLRTLARIQLDNNNSNVAVDTLWKSCNVDSHHDNMCYLHASELLFENSMIKLSKEYLLAGISKGSKMYGPYYLNNARLYNTLGLIQTHEGNLNRSRKLFRLAKNIHQKLRIINSDYFSIISNQICIIDKQQEYSAAVVEQLYRQFEKQINLIKRLQHPSEYIQLFCNMGNLLFNSCMYLEARIIMSQCLKHPSCWNTLSNDSYVRLFSSMACIEIKEKDAVKAQVYFKYATQRQRESFAIRTDLVSRWTSYHLHNNLAMLYYRKGEYRKAIVQYEQVFESLQDLQETEATIQGSFIHLNYNVGCVYKKALYPDRAIEYYHEADRLAMRMYGDAHIYKETIGDQIEAINKQRILELSAEHDESTTRNVSFMRHSLIHPHTLPKKVSHEKG